MQSTSILERLEKVVQLHPERVAFASKTKVTSYQVLWQRVADFVGKFKKEFTSPGSVLVYGASDVEMLSGMLAANVVGRAYVPVDSHTPASRVKMIVDSSNPAAIVMTEPEEELAKEFSTRFPVILASDVVERSTSVALDLSEAVRGSESQYIIYTSGTTGVPKGVEVSQASLLSFTEWMLRDFESIEENQVLLQAPFSFDLSIFSLYPALCSGGTLVSLSKEETGNFKWLFERLNTTEINTWISTPSFVDICLLDPSFTKENHSKLTQFIFCGEELRHSTAKKLLQKFSNCVVWNTYGPTEATGAITSVKVTPELLATYPERLPIGKAKLGVEIQIHDPETKQPVVHGERGEIVIVGDSVAKGYYRNVEKTEEVFGKVDGKPAYYTGDAGCFDEEGQLLYQGRIDFQVKFNGYRIELQDIEAHLSALEVVEKAVVLPQIGQENKVLGLVAVIVAADSVAEERAFIRQVKLSLKERIMDYMMPSRFVLLEELPLNRNGKIDRKALNQKLFSPVR